ncbi:DUF4468 domain-containing protein [Bacteroides ovatus]|uniref:DUF4468 domain-containing protein n=1 Tax=Bacteroides ovatus TaxID=28116 RepID=UPI00234C2FCB|nr:DUF4468 domain-containing protein [Bacteroides ovatus]MDC7147556.1 DUF4468 domain-containing protein [Bacteroides ovatus]
MKKILFSLLLLLCSLGTMAQKPLNYSEVIQVEGMSAKDIYNTAKRWFVANFKDANSVIQVDNPTDGVLTGKGNIPFEYKNLTWTSSSGCIWFIVDIKVKDGRFKMTISDFRHESHAPKFAKEWSLGAIYDAYLPEYKHQHKKIWDKVEPMCIEEFSILVSSIKDFMKKNKVEEDDNW